jgi:hypothetical protein
MSGTAAPLPAQLAQGEPAKGTRASQQGQDPDLVFQGPVLASRALELCIAQLLLEVLHSAVL